MKSLDVKVWGVRKRNTKKSSYDVRWTVSGSVFSEQFRTKGLADHYRAKLLRAAPDGEEFDTVTGLPDSMVERAPSVTWYAFALKYLAMKWPHAAPNTRNGINESLTAVSMALLDDRPGRPSEIVNNLHWVTKASRPLSDLADTAIGRAVLDSLKLKLDGTATAAETVRRKRRTLVSALHYAVDLGEFKENPITAIRWKKPRSLQKRPPAWSPILSRLAPC